MAAGEAGRSRIGLALGGGAARGWAHIGIIKALAEAGIEPDIVTGTSIGAVVGGCHLAGRLDELEVFARSLNRRRVMSLLDFNLAGTGLITGGKLGALLERHIGDRAIEDLPKPFAAVATELGTGHEVWLRRGGLVAAMRASYALPGIFPPVEINRRWLFDGALVNPIPVSVCRALGARYVIAVNLNADMCARGTVVPEFDEPVSIPELQPSENEPAQPAGSMRSLLRRQWFGSEKDPKDHRPGISAVLVDALSIVQDRISRSRLAGDPPDTILSPRLSGIGPFEFHRADELISHGRDAARREIDELKHHLELRARSARSPSQPATM
jgi:NTE family protein